MRRKDREITDYEQMKAVMGECSCCRLGLRDGGGVYIVPLNFGFCEEEGRLTLYFHGAAEGKKLDLLRAQAQASFEMDCAHALAEGETACQYSYFYKSIIGRGRVALAQTAEEKERGLSCIMRRYSGRGGWEFPPAVLERTAVIRLEVGEWSCKAHFA